MRACMHACVDACGLCEPASAEVHSDPRRCCVQCGPPASRAGQHSPCCTHASTSQLHHARHPPPATRHWARRGRAGLLLQPVAAALTNGWYTALWARSMHASPTARLGVTAVSGCTTTNSPPRPEKVGCMLGPVTCACRPDQLGQAKLRRAAPYIVLRLACWVEQAAWRWCQ